MAIKKEYSGLEILRFLCAVSVLVWHYQHFFVTGHDGIPANFHRELQPFYSELSPLYDFGYIGVTIFFVISGFIFFWKYREPIHCKIIDGKTFFVLRFSRLYPLHFLTLILVAVLQWLYIANSGFSFVYPHNDAYHFILNLFFASYWGFQKGYSFNAPVWSVSLEIIAYAVFFWTARFTKLSLTQSICIVISTYVVEKLLGMHDIFNCLRFFFAGGCVFLIAEKTKSIDIKYRLPPLFVITLSSAYLFYIAVGKLQAVSFAIFSAGIVALIAVAENSARGTTMQQVAPYFGNLTYSSYLCHFPIQLVCVLVTDALVINRDVYFHPAVFLTFIVGTLGLSHFVYRFYEMPVQARIRGVLLKDRIKAECK